jgi:predicted alpha/beta-hydrolase family hydrolase
VKCDGQTHSQHDIAEGIVNILVGFAPVKPAEFVVLTIRQTAAQVPTRAMPAEPTQPPSFTLVLPDGSGTKARVDEPAAPRAALVLAHGAGAGMHHPFMEAVAVGLAQRGIACLRFNFPFMDRASRRPDPPALAHAVVRAACAQAQSRWPQLPLFAGGKSYGGRMASQAQAAKPLPGVRGLVFIGFPLHPANRPGSGRAEHLAQVPLPMLFVQGTRDPLAELTLVRQVVERCAPRARLHIEEGADHAFHVLVRSGRTDARVLESMLDAIAGWMKGIAAH